MTQRTDTPIFIDVLRYHKSFKIKLPSIKTYYVPEYKPHYLSIGATVVFSFSYDLQSPETSIYIGVIHRTRIQHGVSWYDINCIQRTIGINEVKVSKISIIKRDIICQLIPEK